MIYYEALFICKICQLYGSTIMTLI